jgi:large subunit ribosomal protein L4
VKLSIQTLDGTAAKGEIELADTVFGIEPRVDILHRVVTWQLEKRRGPARPTRERSDIARTGKKFGRQKGGGTARHGNRRAPIFIGGGKAHGARARTFGHSLNKKVRSLGLRMALSAKAQAGGIMVVDNFDIAEGKTKVLVGQLEKLGMNRALFIDGEATNLSFARASANIHGVNLLPAIGANVYDILKADTLVLTRAAVEQLEARFALPGGAN